MGEAAAATEALARIQQRWGVGVIRRGRVVVDPQLRGLVVRSSGFAALDATTACALSRLCACTASVGL